MLHPVILCGGSGRRLWPASRPQRPKPFLPLVGGETTFDGALKRAADLAPDTPVTIVSGQEHLEALADRLADRPHRLIVEPAARDTAAAIAATCLVLAEADPEAMAVFLPADHAIRDGDGFRSAVHSAASAAENGAIAVLGAPPQAPSTAYGYVLPAPGASLPRPVDRFIEKPDAETAARLVAEGWLWNCGVFIARADAILSEMARLAPEILEPVRRAVEAREGVRLGPGFLDAPAAAFDRVVMERTLRAVVQPADIGWSDLGAWDAVLAASERDDRGNSALGQVVLEAASDCLVRAPDGVTVAIVGARNLAVIIDDRAVMICDLSAGEDVRRAVDRISAAGR